jgi:hypothetical protein
MSGMITLKELRGSKLNLAARGLNHLQRHRTSPGDRR